MTSANVKEQTSDVIYLVLCYSTTSLNYLWIGGEQNNRLADAKYWHTEEEAQAVAKNNRDSHKKFIKENKLEAAAVQGFITTFQVIPMSRKTYMKQCLIEE